MRVRGANALLALGASLLSLAGLELSLRLLVSHGLLAVAAPLGAGSGFWVGDHPVYGVWHRPNASFEQTSSCYRAEYRTNSLGARDRERQPVAQSPRTIVLGDSFLEGWGLPVERRLSNLLEAWSGTEYMNLAMAHFSPYQAYLVYRELGARFDHDRVMVGITPENDFMDLDLERARSLPGYVFRYRPYLVEDHGGYRQLDHREGRVHRWLRHHTYAFHVFRAARRRLALLLGSEPVEGPPPLPDGYSEFYDFSERGFGRLRRSLELIVEAAGEREVVVVLIPAPRDLYAWRRRGPDALAKRLEALPVTVVDLLPAFATAPERRQFFFRCDYHWTARANEMAAREILRQLGERAP